MSGDHEDVAEALGLLRRALALMDARDVGRASQPYAAMAIDLLAEEYERLRGVRTGVDRAPPIDTLP